MKENNDRSRSKSTPVKPIKPAAIPFTIPDLAKFDLNSDDDVELDLPAALIELVEQIAREMHVRVEDFITEAILNKLNRHCAKPSDYSIGKDGLMAQDRELIKGLTKRQILRLAELQSETSMRLEKFVLGDESMDASITRKLAGFSADDCDKVAEDMELGARAARTKATVLRLRGVN